MDCPSPPFSFPDAVHTASVIILIAPMVSAVFLLGTVSTHPQ